MHVIKKKKLASCISARPGLDKKLLGGFLALITALGVNAQDQTTEDEKLSMDMLEEVVVTGSLIRGIRPAGSNVIGIESEAIIEIGALSATDILATIPQANNLFNDRATLNPQALSQNTIIKPNLRGLPGVTQTSGSSTLVMFDGHRVAGMGVINASPDPDIIPPAVLERVEVITDGGSSLYGADAVGGVINFIAKKEYEGVQIDVGYGSADDYTSTDLNLTAGTKWADGSAYISIGTAEHDSLVGGDRDWSLGGTWTADGRINVDNECIDPVGSVQNWVASDFGGVIAPATVWVADGAPSITGSNCNKGEFGALLPEEERDNLFFNITQILSDNVELEVNGFWSERTSKFPGYPLGAAVSFGPSTFEQTGAPGAWLPAGSTTQGGSVGFSFAPNSAYRHHDDESSIEAWGITPTLTIDMNNGWQLRTLLHYSESESYQVGRGVNTVLLNSYADSGAIDPLDIASTDAAVINDILNFESKGQSEQELLITRVIADGVIMRLPAGELRTAIGIELMNETSRLRRGVDVVGFLDNEDFPQARRDVRSLFAEVNVPLLSNLPGVQSLVLSASGRYDEYSDFGSTTNPQVSLTWEPVDWVSAYVSWSEAFNAPTLMDTLQALGAQSSYFDGLATFGGIGTIVSDEGLTLLGDDIIQIRGANSGLEPQTAEIFASGLAIEPIQNLSISLNYYDIDFVNLLAFPNPLDATNMRSNRQALRFNTADNPITQQELEDFLAQSFNGSDVLAQVPSIGDIGTLIDLRLTNTNEVYLKGVDFAVNYLHETSFGTMLYGIAGNHALEFDQIRGGIKTDGLEGTSDSRWSAFVSLQKGSWNSKLTWKHTDGFDADSAALDPVTNEPVQKSVDSFDVFDLFVGYQFNADSGLAEGLSLRFNVDNMLDEDPPIYRQNGTLPTSGFTLGRLFKISFTKTFQ